MDASPGKSAAAHLPDVVGGEIISLAGGIGGRRPRPLTSPGPLVPQTRNSYRVSLGLVRMGCVAPRIHTPGMRPRRALPMRTIHGAIPGTNFGFEVLVPIRRAHDRACPIPPRPQVHSGGSHEDDRSA